MKTYRDLEGDGGSNVLRQVVELKEKIASKLEPIEMALAVGSGKGGVGKSTLTMLLAQALNTRGRCVAVLDADLNGPSQARLGGLKTSVPVPGRRGLVVPRTRDGVGVVSFGTMVPESEAVDFPSIAQGDSHTWRATKEFATLADFLAGTDWEPFDTLLFDLPPGAERTFQYAEFLGPQTQFVLVTLPSDLSRGVVRRSLAALRKTPNPLLGYIQNMSGYYCACCGQVRPLFPESSEVEIDLAHLGSVPFDPELARLCDQGLSPRDQVDSPAWQSILKIAKEL
ncbi:MAG TPA: P-loop NTPase [Acidobacteriota bacterium]|nr:P-loop NTPase [Acidobacteriota bacterium]